MYNRKREHDMIISRERAEFDIGKENLANTMGLDASTFTQEQIDPCCGTRDQT